MGPTDLIALLAGWLVSTGVVLLWVHRSRQAVVPRSWPHSRMIVLRVGALFGFVVLIFSAGVGVSVPLVSTVTTLVVLLLPMTSLGALEAADSASGLALLVIIIGPLVALRQYIFGGPEMDEIVLKPPSAAPLNSSQGGPEATFTGRDSFLPEDSAGAGARATVVAVLRPTGFVMIEGRRAEARSHDGRLIDVGCLVEVCGRQNRQLLVRPVPRDST
jgi:hypothetical protein